MNHVPAIDMELRPAGRRGLTAAVVVPTHRRLDRLEIALASVEAQSRRADEVRVVAADPAEHEAVAIVLARTVSNDAAKALSGERKLLGGAARNLGWRDTRADVVLFLDDDDSWRADKIEQHLLAHETLVADVVYSGATYVHGDKMVSSPATPPSEDMAASLVAGTICPPSTSCVSVRREALEAVGGFDGELPSYQDWELWLRLARARRTFASLPDGLTFFVQHEGDRVSMNIEGRRRAAEMVLARHPGVEGLHRFFEAEARHMIERKVVFTAMQGDPEAFTELRLAVLRGQFSLLAYRPYWILAKALYHFAQFRLRSR